MYRHRSFEHKACPACPKTDEAMRSFIPFDWLVSGPLAL